MFMNTANIRREEIAAMRWEHLDRTPHAGGNEARVLLLPETKNGDTATGTALHVRAGGLGWAP